MHDVSKNVTKQPQKTRNVNDCRLGFTESESPECSKATINAASKQKKIVIIRRAYAAGERNT